MKRILWHVPEIGVHVVRHFGLYVSKSQKNATAVEKKLVD